MIENWWLLAITEVVLLVVAIIGTFFPHVFVRIVARDVRGRLLGSGLTEEEVEKMKLSLLDKNDDQFLHLLVKRGLTHPSEFTELVNGAKIIGRIAWILIILSILGMIFGTYYSK